MATKKQKTAATEVPEGSVADVMKWVGDDPERASTALAAEQEKPEDDQRETLTEPLEKMLAAEESSDEGTPDAPESSDDPAPAAAAVGGEEASGDDTVLLEDELIVLALPARGARMTKRVAASAGQRISKARVEEIERQNEEIEKEAAERAKTMDVREPAEDDEG